MVQDVDISQCDPTGTCTQTHTHAHAHAHTHTHTHTHTQHALKYNCTTHCTVPHVECTFKNPEMYVALP